MSFPRATKIHRSLALPDWLSAAIALAGTMFCCYFAAFIDPRFQKLLADFGSDYSALTRLALMPWFPLLLGLIPASMVALALAGNTSLSVRRVLLGWAGFLALSASGLCLYGIYSPLLVLIWSLK